MKLGAEQMEAAGELLKRRIAQKGGPALARARELCAQELKGWITPEELLAAYEPDVAPVRWVAGEHERGMDYYDPQVLAAVADESTAPVAADSDALLVEREAIARIFRRLDSGLLKRRVKWVARYYTLQPGDAPLAKKGPGWVQCGEARVEWLDRAVLIMNGGEAVRAFVEARLKRVHRHGKGGSRKPVAELVVPELDVPELGLRRIAVSVAVLLRRLRWLERELRSAADIARAAGMTRANVSARQIKMEAEEAAEGPAKFKARKAS